MTATTVNALPTGEVAYLLRRALGTARGNWNDFLADCIRGKTSFHGLALLPIATAKAPGDRRKRPWYAAGDVREFIEAALAITGHPPHVKKLAITTIKIDPAAMALPWPMRKATSSSSTSKKPPTE